MRFHWQNLNEKKGGEVGSPLRHGRAWLRLGRWSFGWEWSIPSRFCHVSAKFMDGDDDVSLSFAPVICSAWFHFSHPVVDRFLRRFIRDYEGREIEFSIHDGAFWWSFWHPTMSWDSRTPRWRHGSFYPADFLLGRAKYKSENLKTERAVVPMPEGGYPATVTINRDSWKRPRWPKAKVVVRAEIKPDTPIPFPGKGENSWDCGEDASHSLYGPYDNTLDAVLAMSKSVMRSRLKYGGGWNYKAEKGQA